VSGRPSQPAKPRSVCGEPSVAAEELPLDGGLVRYCLKHLREHEPGAADFLENLRRRQQSVASSHGPLASIVRAPTRSRLSLDCSPHSITRRYNWPNVQNSIGLAPAVREAMRPRVGTRCAAGAVFQVEHCN
jgi:hypothetical protein